MEDVDIIRESDQVVFRRESCTRVFQIRKNRQIYFDKSKIDVNALIGEPYGSRFEIDREKVIKLDQQRLAQLQNPESSSKAGIDNRNLLDLDSNQKMSKSEIMKMKDEGVTGEKIIEALIENSETFHSKTEYSQAKFLKKKKKKHVLVFTVLKPTPRLVMEIFAKDPSKICYLRPDSLSQILSYSNLMSGSRVAVVESCQGLLLACVLQRIGASGKLIQLIPNSTNSVCRQVIDYFGYKKDDLDNMYTFPLDELASLNRPNNREKDSSCDPPVPPSCSSLEDNCKSSMTEDNENNLSSSVTENVTFEKTQISDAKDQDSKGAEADDFPPKSEREQNTEAPETKEKTNHDKTGVIVNEENMESESKEDISSNKETERVRRAVRQKKAGDMIKDKQLDSLIIACKYNPSPILMRMMEFMPPSRYVVVHCQFLQPLVECYNCIKEKHCGLQLKLSETWMREYQILPQRTHPMMNMSGTGGYLLSFITRDPQSSQDNF